MNNIRIKKISIEGYKGIEHLDIEFPLGRMVNDPDICVLGSKNGIGKTSILECCTLLLLSASMSKKDISNVLSPYVDVIYCGMENAKICGILTADKNEHEVSIEITKNGKIHSSGMVKFLEHRDIDIDVPYALRSVLGINPDPVIGNRIIFLHSYRKTSEGKPELGMMLNDENIFDRRLAMHYRFQERRNNISFSIFKRAIIRYLMREANLFEATFFDSKEDDMQALDILNALLQKYADVRIGKLRPYEDNTLDIQVEKIDNPQQRFSIDGLSSGQKEIISTLFLIWHITHKKQSIVLIDEPELHLNSQWHASFIKSLLDIAPHNQYIIATHAENIMASVVKENRILLVSDKNEGK